MSTGADSLEQDFLSGCLTKDPEVKYSQNGNAFVRVGIAVDRPFSKNKEVDFFNLVTFGKTAEFLGKYFVKGSKLLVEGRLQNSSYTDKDGNKRTANDVVVDNVEFADSKKKSQGNSGVDDFPPPDDFDSPF